MTNSNNNPALQSLNAFAGTSADPIVLRGSFFTQFSSQASSLLTERPRRTLYFFRNKSGTLNGRLSISGEGGGMVIINKSQGGPLARMVAKLTRRRLKEETIVVSLTPADCVEERAIWEKLSSAANCQA